MALQLNNLAAVFDPPNHDRVISPRLSHHKGADRHSDNQFTAVDMHSTTPDLIGRSILDKNWQRHATRPPATQCADKALSATPSKLAWLIA